MKWCANSQTAKLKHKHVGAHLDHPSRPKARVPIPRSRRPPFDDPSHFNSVSFNPQAKLTKSSQDHGVSSAAPAAFRRMSGCGGGGDVQLRGEVSLHRRPPHPKPQRPRPLSSRSRMSVSLLSNSPPFASFKKLPFFLIFPTTP